MTIAEAIAAADAVKPNAFEDSVKIRWLNELEGRIAITLMLMSPAEAAQLQYTTADEEKELLIDPPFDDLYPLWLQAKIDFANGEYDKYANTMQVYNTHYSSFACWFLQEYEPSQGYREVY